MSANNETLVVEHEGKFYVFSNVMAESWAHYDEKTHTLDDTRMNELPIKEAVSVHETRDEAFDAALIYDQYMDTEYGVQFNQLYKDSATVNLV